MSSAAPDIDSHREGVPRHVAIIMDGNNRWAKKHNLKTGAGHKAGADNLRHIVEVCAEAGVEALTVFAFSSENWRRPEQEVTGLMELFMDSLAKEVPDLHKNNIRLEFIGDLSRFSAALQKRMQESTEYTKADTKMVLSVAVNYGGQSDIVNTAKLLAEKVLAGEINPSDITDELFSKYISLAHLPPVDLCIRTGGEYRISNFLLWQVAYAELYFSDALWPDFKAEQLQLAFDAFENRERRFGRTSEQVEGVVKNA